VLLAAKCPVLATFKIGFGLDREWTESRALSPVLSFVFILSLPGASP